MNQHDKSDSAPIRIHYLATRHLRMAITNLGGEKIRLQLQRPDHFCMTSRALPELAAPPSPPNLPAACRNENPALRSPADLRQRLAEIPTLLQIKSDCDSQLLTVAAAKVVAQNRNSILEFLNGAPAGEASPAPATAPAPPGHGPPLR